MQTMNNYSIYVEFVKITIYKKLDYWFFTAKSGSRLLASGGDFPTREDCEKNAKQLVLQLIDHEKNC